MEVIPAIDLRGGRCVRLYQGDFQRETVYSDDPVAMALQWQEQGAPRLHIVDLDGAQQGLPVNLKVLQETVSRVDIPLQVGGGLRRLEMGQQLLDMGVERLVFGTIAVEQPHLVQEACQRFGSERVVVAVDARDGIVAVRGWEERTSVGAVDLVRAMAALGVSRFLYTDIARDGTLTEPNFDAIEGLVGETGANILASGGIASLEHLRRLKALGVEGAIIGSALYSGRIRLEEALKVAASTP
ncbi:MAG: 1-(5-phosphoribosyl)-5-[(5-phosphoribosylamino)methylideneamino]imidazole-4-carboxamide isomerase [Dehalococcoidia bacterium]